MGKTLLIGALLTGSMIAATILIPFLLVWCLNTLGIATASYGVAEWFAAAILTAFLLGGSAVES